MNYNVKAMNKFSICKPSFHYLITKKPITGHPIIETQSIHRNTEEGNICNIIFNVVPCIVQTKTEEQKEVLTALEKKRRSLSHERYLNINNPILEEDSSIESTPLDKFMLKKATNYCIEKSHRENFNTSNIVFYNKVSNRLQQELSIRSGNNELEERPELEKKHRKYNLAPIPKSILSSKKELNSEQSNS